MARGLRELTVAIAGSEPVLIRKPRILNSLSRFSLATGLGGSAPVHEHFQALAAWKPAEEQALIVLARHLIAIERHWVRHRRLPSRLEDLDGDLRRALPLDPATAKPLDYEWDGHGRFKLGYAAPWDKERGRAAWEFPLGR